MKTRTAPCTRRTIEVLLGRIHELAGSGQLRLPTTNQIALEIGVSPGTVSKAVRALAERGIVEAKPKNGIWISRSDAALPDFGSERIRNPPVSTLPRWHTIMNQINRDILRGQFPPGRPLPLLKELAQRYATCPATVKTALVSLVQEDRLIPFKRGYQVYQTAHRQSRPLLVVIAQGSDLEHMFGTAGVMSSEFWRKLEMEACRIGIDLETFMSADAMGSSGNLARYRRFREVQKNRTIVGYFAWMNSPSFDDIVRLSSELGKTGRPVSVLNEVRGAQVEEEILRHRQFKLFCNSIGSLPGKLVGDFLIGLGHRTVACFSPYGHYNTWSTQRIEGIRRSFAAAGLENGVKEFVIDQSDRATEIFMGMPGSRSFAKIQKYFLKAVQTVNPGADASNLALYDGFKTIVWRQSLERIMKPLFHQALEAGDATAWIGVNDDVALSALDFLRSKDARVPRAISVIGFDDRLESLSAGLTSYNFNIPAVLMAMLDHVLDGRMTRQRGADVPIEIPGIIIERASTGKARG